MRRGHLYCQIGLFTTVGPWCPSCHHVLTRRTVKVGRNDPCRCGSGRKAKKCCGAEA